MTRARRPPAEIPPQALDIEETLLGGLLLAGSATVRTLSIDPEDFFEEAHRTIYGVVAALADAGLPVSEHTVADELRRHDELDAVGGLVKLATLIERGHVESYLPEYARRLRALRAKRETLATALRIADRARNGVDPEALLADVESLATDLRTHDQPARLALVVTAEGDDLRLEWPLARIVMLVSAPRESAEGVSAELSIERDGRVLHSFGRLHLASTSSREALAKKLRDQAPTVDWRALLESVVGVVIPRVRRGAPVVALEAKRREQAPDLILGVVPKGETTVDFGDGGVGKSLAAAAKALAIRTGHPIGRFQVAEPGPVLVLDYETTLAQWQDTYAKLAAGAAISTPPPLLYRQGVRGLADDAAELRRIIASEGVICVIVDSLAPACGPEPETADAAVRTMAALRSFGTTNLVLAHVSKATADAPGPARPFGSVFVRNLARVLWEIRRESDDADGLRLACYQRKNNLGPVAPSFGLHCTFTEQAITVASLDLATAPDLLERATLWQRIVVALKTGALSVEELGLGLDAKEPAIRKALERHRGKGVLPLPSTSPAKWGLSRA